MFLSKRPSGIEVSLRQPLKQELKSVTLVLLSKSPVGIEVKLEQP